MDRKKHLYSKKDVDRKKHLDSKEDMDSKKDVDGKKHLDSKKRLDSKKHLDMLDGIAQDSMIGGVAAERGPTGIHGMGGPMLRRILGTVMDRCRVHGCNVTGAAAGGEDCPRKHGAPEN